MPTRSRRIGLAGACLLGVLSLLGCATPRLTAQNPSFEPAHLDRAALVLTVASGAEAGLLSVETHLGLREALRDSVVHALTELAAHFGTEVSEHPPGLLTEAEWEAAAEAYDHVLAATIAAVQRGEPLDVAVPSELAGLSETAGARHLLAVRTTGWRKTTANRVLSALHATPSAGTGVEILLLDAATSRVVWFGQHYADLDPARSEEVRAVTAALLFELYTGRRVSAFSFLPWPEGAEVTAWLHDGGRATGRIVRRDGFDLVLRLRDGAEERIPLASVRSVRQPLGGPIFPAQRVSSAHKGLF